MVGWETGRTSEPEFMNMNLHAVRGDSSPPVVLYQFDQADPMNPLGLLIAYAEKQVKPVVSDFDTFTVGSRGMRYDPTPPLEVVLSPDALWPTADLSEGNRTAKLYESASRNALRHPRVRSTI